MIDYLGDNPFKTDEDYFLINMSYRCCFTVKLIYAKKLNVAKSNISKESIIGHYYFFNHGFKFQDSVCKDSYELTMLSLNVRNIAIITVKCVDYSLLFMILANLKQLIC